MKELIAITVFMTVCFAINLVSVFVNIVDGHLVWVIVSSLCTVVSGFVLRNLVSDLRSRRYKGVI